jgi:hypothetical protein
MSGQGNGTAMENGNGTIRPWSLTEDGMLWKTVLDYATSDFQEQAQAFVAQLQESTQPADALQGVLLDRIAAGYLRKRLALEAEAAAIENVKRNTAARLSGGSAEVRKMITDADVQHLWFRNGEVLRYEALLDQALQRDLILLMQLKKAASAALALGAKKPPKSDRGLIEGASEFQVG